MTTQSNVSSDQIAAGRTANLLRVVSSNLKYRRSSVPPDFTWKSLTASHPLVYLLQPDYYAVFRAQTGSFPVFQCNLSLEAGGEEVRYSSILHHIDDRDLTHLRKVDQVLFTFAKESRLQSFDFICSTVCQWNIANETPKHLVRKTTILTTDENRAPEYILVTFQDISSIVSSVRPFNVDVTFIPDKAWMSNELSQRMRAIAPKSSALTPREKEIVHCLSKGFCSKEIADQLFISKATVDTHRQNLLRKWEVANTAGLLKKVFESGAF